MEGTEKADFTDIKLTWWNVGGGRNRVQTLNKMPNQAPKAK
jgi:hypothetical protein